MLISDSKENIMKLLQITSVLFILFLFGCVKQNFDTVPEYKVNYEANTTIADLKAMYQGTNIMIDTNLIIKGIVVADDQSGNFYKELYLQDETGAINLRLDQAELYFKYPVGRLVYVKCQNLYIGPYQEVMQIGWGPAVDRIPTTYMSREIVPDISAGGTPVEPKLLTLGTLNDDDLGKVIKLENIQFVDGDLSKTYANGTAHIDASTTIEDCNGNVVIIRTSGYSIFANETVAQGNGTMIAILGKYGGDYQLKIRTTDELDMNGTRCTK
jgi:hypothetical protein